MWGPWMITPPTSKEQKKKWEDIPANIFWIKISIILAVVMFIGVLLSMVINI